MPKIFQYKCTMVSMTSGFSLKDCKVLVATEQLC